jgi:hypothetical protein
MRLTDLAGLLVTAGCSTVDAAPSCRTPFPRSWLTTPARHPLWQAAG